jgi:hypothetical protein
VTSQIEKSLLDIDFAELTRRTFTPSPAAWEDQILAPGPEAMASAHGSQLIAAAKCKFTNRNQAEE